MDFGLWILDWPRTRHAIQNPKSKIHNRPGFTLVEVLVVMIILAILAAVVVPEVTAAARVSR